MSLVFPPPRPDTMESAPHGSIEAARGLRLALDSLKHEALDHGFRFCALHLQVAILELDSVIAVRQH